MKMSVGESGGGGEEVREKEKQQRLALHSEVY